MTLRPPVIIRRHYMNDQAYTDQAKLRLLAIHTAEGARTDESLATFCDRMNDRSYHDGCDDDSLTRMVYHNRSAWHLRGGNKMALGLCLMGFAKWTRKEWLQHKKMLQACSWWIEKESWDHEIPLRKLTSSQVGKVVRNPRLEGGVCGHIDYTNGTGDGTHWDPGHNFPWDLVMARAGEYRDERLGDMSLSSTDLSRLATAVTTKLLETKLPDPDNESEDATIKGIIQWDWVRSRRIEADIKEIKERLK